MDNIKESKEYKGVIGKCPICGTEAEIIKSTGDLRKSHIKYKTCCKNEYYQHVVSEQGLSYIYKFIPPKVNNRFHA